MGNLIEIAGLSKTYEGFSLKRVDLKVPAGCVVGLVGPNGAGKTTIIKALLGLVAPESGDVALLGCQANVEQGTAAFSSAKERVGVVFDTCPFPGEIRCKDVSLIGSAAFSQWDSAAFAQYLRDFEVSPKKKVKDLSRGMGMKLQLAFSLAHDPQLLVLDEATAGLDPLARDAILDVLRDFMNDESHGILLSTHITSDLDKVADYVVCLNAGTVVFSQPIDEISDVAGIVKCSAANAHELMQSALFDPDSLRVVRGEYAVEVLVPSRALLHEKYPNLVCERANVESYMRFMLKGDRK